jgi:alpha-tubulin suppressor-like RCC1 family protein
MIKRKTAFFMVFVMVLSLFVPQTTIFAAEKTRAEIGDASSGTWAYNTVMYAYDRGFLSVDANDSFQPNAYLTRAQFAQQINNWLVQMNQELNFFGVKFAIESPSVFDLSFDSFYYTAVSSVVSKGLMQAPAGYFYPNSYITNEQASLVWLRILQALELSGVNRGYLKNVDYNEILSEFSDGASVAPEYRLAYAVAVDLQFMAGYSDNKLRPARNVSWAEICASLANAELNLIKNVTEYRASPPQTATHLSLNATAAPLLTPLATQSPFVRPPYSNGAPQSTYSPYYPVSNYMRITSLTINPDGNMMRPKATVDFDKFYKDAYITFAYTNKNMSVTSDNITDVSVMTYTRTIPIQSLSIEEEFASRIIYNLPVESTLLTGPIHVYAIIHYNGIRGSVVEASDSPVTLTPLPTPSPSPSPSPEPTPDPDATPTPSPSPSPSPTPDPNTTPTPSPSPSPSPTPSPSPSPTPVPKAVADVSSSVNNHFTLILATDGTVFGIGVNKKGEIITDGEPFYTDSVQIKFPDGVIIKKVFAGTIENSSLSFAIDSDGALWAWGGIGSTAEDRLPVSKIDTGGAKVTDIFQSTGKFILALAEDGSLIQCDVNEYFGNTFYLPISDDASANTITADKTKYIPVFKNPFGAATPKFKPENVKVVGENYAALDNDGNLWSWGECSGVSAVNFIETPQNLCAVVGSPLEGKKISAFDIGIKTILLKSENDVFGFGEHIVDENGMRQDFPFKIALLSNATEIRVTKGLVVTSIFVRANGETYAWGDNKYGQLLLETFAPPQSAPVKLSQSSTSRISSPADIIDTTSAATLFSFKTDGSEKKLFGWGWNKDGQLGLGKLPQGNADLADRWERDVEIDIPEDISADKWTVRAFGGETYIIADGKLFATGNVYFGLIDDGSPDVSYTSDFQTINIGEK